MFLIIALACYLIVGGCIAILILPFATMAATDGPTVKPWYMVLPFVIGALWPLATVIALIDNGYRKIKSR